MTEVSHPAGPERRRAELAANLAAVREQVHAAARRSGRAAESVTVIAVTKTFPASDVRLLAELGVADIGENRDAEAAEKADQCADLALRWHFVGQLQTNKARSVTRYASCVHSVDRPKLVTALARAVDAHGGQVRPLRCLVQVDLDERAPAGRGRGGVPVPEVASLADTVAATPGLELGGLMAVAPLGLDPAPAFARLRAVAARIRADHPGATWLSAGMSGDLATAVEFGATHVRVGRALLGTRPSLR